MEYFNEVLNDIEKQYQAKHSVDGVSFVAYRDTNRLGTDDDNALLTGMYLGAASFRAAVRGITEEDLEPIFDALEGISLLTNVTGVPGVLVRQAFPYENSWNRIGYDPVMSLTGGNSFGEKLRRDYLYHGDFMGEEYVYLTKTTKDQMTGILFGLTCAHILIPEARDIVRDIVSAIWHRMKVTDYSLVDHTGRTHGTTAYKLDEPLRVCLNALYRASVNASARKPDSWFFKPCFNRIATLHYNRRIQNTYSYNLNLLMAHALLMLEPYHMCDKGVLKWRRILHNKVAGDENPHFDLLGQGYMSNGSVNNLWRRMSEPYHKGFCWSRDPEEWFGHESDKIGPSIDVILPMWMARYYELI